MDEHKITKLLKAWGEGDKKALDNLIPLVDKELRKIAHQYMRKESREHILQTTALVNEAIIKLIRDNISYENRKHFYVLVAKRMRQVLIDYARQRTEVEHVEFDEQAMAARERSKELILLDEALKKFEKSYKRQAEVVECRYFIGLTIKETAKVLEIGESTVERDWDFARTWLKREMTTSII
jgi:RNA polymerase sigma-70 factor, ECF subfamily